MIAKYFRETKGKWATCECTGLDGATAAKTGSAKPLHSIVLVDGPCGIGKTTCIEHEAAKNGIALYYFATDVDQTASALEYVAYCVGANAGVLVVEDLESIPKGTWVEILKFVKTIPIVLVSNTNYIVPDKIANCAIRAVFAPLKAAEKDTVKDMYRLTHPMEGEDVRWAILQEPFWNTTSHSKDTPLLPTNTAVSRLICENEAKYVEAIVENRGADATDEVLNELHKHLPIECMCKDLEVMTALSLATASISEADVLGSCFRTQSLDRITEMLCLTEEDFLTAGVMPAVNCVGAYAVEAAMKTGILEPMTMAFERHHKRKMKTGVNDKRTKRFEYAS